ncbi:MAG: crotonase/enoyl-CoA hydratase family protein [Betaproteobacteria bacterium]|nr:crotonase/enoyl-CoA hydratase family protein [Betaproteobacteria bacterium]
MNMIVPPALLIPEQVAGHVSEDGVDYTFSNQLRASFRKDQGAIWSRWNPSPRPCFNPRLLADIRSYYDFLSATSGKITAGTEEHNINYVVLASEIPGVFNLGGDLDLFKMLIGKQDRAGLLYYGRACIEVLHRNYISHELPATTISLVQGECLGGGFEAALSSDVIIAEKGSRFGFPEILFNLFPGMGAYSFLDRKVGQKLAEQLITSGRLYSAEEMHAMGVVDMVVADGEGEAGVSSFISSRQRTQVGHFGLAAARRRVHGIDFAELMDVVEIWVDCALRLNLRDLKLMHRLVSRQNGLGESREVH